VHRCYVRDLHQQVLLLLSHKQHVHGLCCLNLGMSYTVGARGMTLGAEMCWPASFLLLLLLLLLLLS
jgi:hypothetical protein